MPILLENSQCVTIGQRTSRRQWASTRFEVLSLEIDGSGQTGIRNTRYMVIYKDISLGYSIHKPSVGNVLT